MNNLYLTDKSYPMLNIILRIGKNYQYEKGLWLFCQLYNNKNFSKNMIIINHKWCFDSNCVFSISSIYFKSNRLSLNTEIDPF